MFLTKLEENYNKYQSLKEREIINLVEYNYTINIMLIRNASECCCLIVSIPELTVSVTDTQTSKNNLFVN